MTDAALLLSIAYKAERAASRKLAARSGMSEQDALRAILTAASAGAGIDALVAARQAVLASTAQRASARLEQRENERLARAARHAGAASSWRAWFDGSATPNPGRCGVGAVLLGPAGQRIEVSQRAGHGSSSEAEYLALIALLDAAIGAGAYDLAIHGDSQVVINDAGASDDQGAPSLAALRAQARALMARIDGVSLHWIPRHRNGEADALSQRAVMEWESSTCGSPDALR